MLVRVSGPSVGSAKTPFRGGPTTLWLMDKQNLQSWSLLDMASLLLLRCGLRTAGKDTKETNSETPEGGEQRLQYTTLPLIFNTDVSVAILVP